MEHALVIKIFRQAMDHPLVTHLIFIFEDHSNAAAWLYFPFVLVKTKGSIAIGFGVSGTRAYIKFVIATDLFTIFR